ncbi:lysine-specific demethylase 4A isoform X1 [Cyprinus carpio]|uniref:[histone H3]-trimethyl-L-lysine(9) demethylase n=1 Tax=Cyprinus carpio TaxID=7962 RepID=A0A8C1RII2_CYPCA|nr:lysine-specific demethylase 4A isoform X1 [Cyprinus carpio]XP_042573974.1 lysine-specific demethylase 4A isoform X1 [Cyprinus carpio]
MASDTPVSRGIMTFYPTIEEFKNFSRYIAYIESQGAHKAGLAKIVPPKNWKPRRSYDDIDDLLIPAPIQQVVTGQSGLFTQYNIQKKAMTVKEFRKTANSDKFCSPRYDDFEELERKYWKNLTFNPPIYGADVNGTLYDPDVKEWNVGHLNTILDTVEHDSGITIEGVNTPYLYFGMWKTTFAWHTEDMDLYSINYLHFGEPKSWYCVPPEHGKRLERLAKGFFPGSSQNCEAFLRHKMTLISPSILKKYGIPFEKITQEAGEFMITFPYGYHAGFNHGFNCAESTNFATRRWIDYGKQAILCSCRKDMVKISMEVFVRKFQPERYELWLAGKDNAPIDHSRPTPEAAEFLGGEEGKSGAQELCFENRSSEGQKKSLAKQRIGTKRHRVCLDLPEEVLPKSETNDEEAEYGKKSRLNTYTEQCREYPELKDEDDLLPLTGSTSLKMLPGSRSTASRDAGLSAENPSSACTQSFPKRHLSIASVPAVPHCLSAVPRISTKPGVASLLFHRTLSPSDALQVHSYAARPVLHKPQQPSIENPREDLSEPDIKPDVRPNTPQPNTKLEIEGEKENKSMKRKLQPLSKLPRLHPLLRESSSDDEIQEPAAEPEETDPWARLLAPMWQSKPRNFRVEKDFNFRMGQQPPYCAVCALFHTYTESDIISLSQSSSAAEEGDKRRSKPLIPEMCFTSSSEGHLSTPNVEEDGTSQLVSCSVCSVRVHTSCYGVSQDTNLDEWRCSRCEANAITQDCCLCSLRGGALQKANNDKWVHVLCAVAVLEARFVNIAERSPVDLSSIPLQRFKLKCQFCRKWVKKSTGCCVQCSHGRCSTSFHPSCAQAAGVQMHPDDWPFVVYFTCWRHKGGIQIEQRNKASMRELEKGQKVICKHRNGRYYHCEVFELTQATFYEVVFDDGSFSDNLFPEDIVNRDCRQLGPPSKGDIVQVLWTDGLIYGAKFVSEHIIPMYQVEFEDESQLTVKREDVYSLDEELPKRVKARLSVASDMRFKGVFVEKEVKQDSKRQRVINSRYRGDYIEPVMYRAIME